jgi:hypothetical protein
MTKIDLTKAAKIDLMKAAKQNEVADQQQETKPVSLIGSLIATSSSNAATSRGNQKLATADLTAMASTLANDIISELDKADNITKYQALFDKSRTDNDSLDLLIETVSPISNIENIKFLVDVGEEELDKMLRSQQSKRSRSKNKDGFTLEDYKTMLTAAIAEGLIRKAMGKPKGAGGASFDGSDFTEKQIEEFKADEETLAKAIRNVQSKKSIMKYKNGFDETSDQWQHLLSQEAFLKNLRDNNKPVITPEIEDALTAKEEAEKLLASVEDIGNLSTEDSTALFNKLKEILASTAPSDEAPAEEPKEAEE